MCLPGSQRFKVGASTGTEETQEKSQGTAKPATTCLGPGDLCDGAGSQGLISVEPLEFIRLIQIEIFPNRGRSLQRDGGTC